jgi:hypothetical protein
MREKCSICKLRFYGSVNKCNFKNCKKKFHPECARINNYYLEVYEENATVKHN